MTNVQREYGELRGAAIALLEQPRRFAEVKHALGISSDAQTHSLLARLRAQGLVERVERGLYRRVGPSRVVPLGIPAVPYPEHCRQPPRSAPASATARSTPPAANEAGFAQGVLPGCE
jgi:SOS-response transcriptional repressor LexA